MPAKNLLVVQPKQPKRSYLKLYLQTQYIHGVAQIMVRNSHNGYYGGSVNYAGKNIDETAIKWRRITQDCEL